MKVLAIGSSAFEIERTCLLSLMKLKNEGNEVSVIIVQENNDQKYRREHEEEPFFAKFGISNVHFIDGFDYSGISQQNANILSSYIRQLNPSLIFMPFWKSFDEKNRILSRTSLIACRGIGNVLMFEEGNNQDFVPTISFIVRREEIKSVTNTGLALEISDGNGGQWQGSGPSADDISNAGLRDVNKAEIQSFEIHRMVLLE